MKLAIFDIDGTLLEGSTERGFWRYLARRGQQGPRQIGAYLMFVLRHLPTYGRTTLKKNKAYLSGLEVTRVRNLAEEFVASEVLPSLYEPAVQRLRLHQRAGDTVILLSGTLEPIASALARALGVSCVSATVCRERSGRFTAELPASHPFGASKLDLAAALAADFGTTLRDASAYGDSRHDLLLLTAVGNPVAVQPDAPLLRTARGNRWDIIAGGDGAETAPDYM